MRNHLFVKGAGHPGEPPRVSIGGAAGGVYGDFRGE